MYPPNQNPLNSYNITLAKARSEERNRLMPFGIKLGILLFIYEFLQSKFLVNIYYYIAYFVNAQEFTLNYATVIKYLQSHKEILDSPIFSGFGNIFIVVFSMLIVLILAVALFKFPIEKVIAPKKEHFKKAAYWFPVAFLLNILLSIVVNFITIISESFGYTIPGVDFGLENVSKTEMLLNMSYIIIIGPVAEELIYRGIILHFLKPYGKTIAILFSGIIFGLMHGNIPQAVAAFGTGCIMATIAIKCNSIFPTILIHIANNLIASFSDIFTAFDLSVYFKSTVSGIITILAIFIGLYLFITQGKKLIPPKENFAGTAGSRFLQVICNPVIAVYFAIVIYQIIVGIVRAN